MESDLKPAATSKTRLLDVILPVPLPQTFTYLAPGGDAEAEPAVGDLVRAPFGRRRGLFGLVVGVQTVSGDVVERNGIRLKKVTEILPEAYRVTDDRRVLLDWMAGYYGLPPGEVLPLFHPPAPGTKARKSRLEKTAYPSGDVDDLTPTTDQRHALDRVGELLEARSFGAVLLHGVTGSGKTEVYLQAIRMALAAGRGAIVLLPEIALTPQTEARIAERFGSRVATIHSALSAGERCRVHEGAARGEIRVVVGARSALFTPIRDLGVVVVDEEHETSYKQDEKPRYHARHAALVRARAADAAIVLGSATPDLESIRNAREGRYDLVTMSDRPVGERPRVELVDMREAEVRDGFSRRLLEAVEETLERGRQAIIYYNRRGFARSLRCDSCGEAVACPHCEIGMTLHLRPRRLLCHYCGFTRRGVEVCEACGEDKMSPTGGGTEKAELVLQALFPGVRLARLDHDTTRRRGSHAEILGGFARGEADLLLGTQMVAKGHHFPGVDLVGVLAADDGLSMPDFRAQERTFQLLTQVAGRAGREQQGLVLFQTWQPEHPIIQAAAAQDYDRFADAELIHRESVGYPPYLRMARVGFSGRKSGDVESAAAEFAALLRERLDESVTVLGPAPAVFPRLQNRHRWHLLLKGPLNVAAKDWLASCLRTLKDRHRGVDVLIDVDPVGMW